MERTDPRGTPGEAQVQPVLFEQCVLGLPFELLARVIDGGAETIRDAGAVIAGGHSIDDPEPKYGMAVTGVVNPRAIVRNSTGRPGDVLFLTKPIGGGAVTTGAKRGTAGDAAIRRCTEVMATLNADAAQAATAVGASAMTDVTGFGLLGHLHELSLASRVAARVEASAVPALPGALELLAGGALAGGSRRNREWLAPNVRFADSVPEPGRALLCDAMTSGGLLVATPAERAADMEDALTQAAPDSARIGTLHSGPAGRIAVI